MTIEQGGASKGHSWGDYDNDTDLDLFVANGTYKPDMFNFLYLNQGNGKFIQDFSGEIIKHADTSAGVAHADFDRDGDLDVFVANWGSNDQINKFYENQTKNKNWISLRLQGIKSNRFGIGSKVSLIISDSKSQKKMFRWMYPVTGYGSQNDYEIHFGLGNYQKIDTLKIWWLSGHQSVHENVKINKHLSFFENDSIYVKH